MKAVFIFILMCVLGFSCSKEELDGFDNQISYAQDFKVDTNGDTIYSLIMPSAFTPDGDGQNDLYHVWGTGIDSSNFEMSVFSREGNLIYYSRYIEQGFDGSTAGYGVVNSNQVYTVKVVVSDILGEGHSYNYDIVQMQ